MLRDGRNVKTVPLASWLRADLSFEALEPIQDPVFALTFHRIDGLQMDHQNTKLMGIETGPLHGKGTASFIFDPLRLGVGEYLITAEILKSLDLESWYDLPPTMTATIASTASTCPPILVIVGISDWSSRRALLRSPAA